MRLDPIERDLLLFLDPTGEAPEATWRIVPWRQSCSASIRSADQKNSPGSTVYCFERNQIVAYLLISWFAKKRGLPLKVRKVLYLNDGLLSTVFYSDKTDGYRAFAACHLPSTTRLRQRLAALLPLAFRAEKRYLVIGQDNIAGDAIPGEDDSVLKALDFMFFSNAAGKLLLTSAQTLCSGNGLVYKTTSSPGYAGVMEKEFATMLGILEMQGEPASLPRVGKKFQSGKRSFFTETYLKGKSLREVLHNLSRSNDIPGICACLDRLDGWFERYRAVFRGQPRSLTSCYRHLFDAFSELYGEDPRAVAILERTRGIVAEISRENGGVATITAHNDLWPGNFVVGAEGVLAIDWERAVGNRAPFFDFYWMVVSAALEHYVCGIGAVDYSRAFRLFLGEGDDVTRHAAGVLKGFLDRLGFDRELHQSFLLLFLMEWSVQGFLALGKQTAMDRLAFGELLFFCDAGRTGAFPG